MADDQGAGGQGWSERPVHVHMCVSGERAGEAECGKASSQGGRSDEGSGTEA